VPTFVIDEKVYSGYRTFEELRELFGCPKEGNQPLSNIEFIGENGEKVSLVDGEIKLDSSIFDGLAYLEVKEGQIIIKQSELEQVANFF